MNAPGPQNQSNVPEFSVGELAFSLKRTIEDQYGHVRVRGELSRVSIAGSGHMYSSLKDDKAVIDAVCWKGVLSKLSIRPEEGMEVICTGRVSTYPQRSNYQLIIESMELAGEGALLKLLEERKKKLAAEGLFAQERKKQRPFLPQKIGVVTSPTGAVIRDILHRLADRFPRHVLLWPVLVQGDGAAEQVTRAIEGFNALGPEHKPDLLIVARGGGSLEDLMPFNEENVVRAVAASDIPVISAVGHETDTTLCDYAADLRAPTPTGAAELAVPVRADLHAQLLEEHSRLIAAMNRQLSDKRLQLEHMISRLGDPARALESKSQQLDHLDSKLRSTFSAILQNKQSRALELGAKLRHPKNQIAEAQKTLRYHSEALIRIGPRLLDQKQRDLASLSRMLETLSYENILKRGYVVVKDEDGKPVTNPDKTTDGQHIQLQFAADKRVDAVIGKTAPPSKPPRKAPSKKSVKSADQHSLFD